MYLTDFSFTILIQRLIELFAFYLILANIYGYDLKASFKRLIRIPQKKFYGNVVLLVVYPVVTTLIIQTVSMPEYVYMVENFVRPFIAYYLLRRAFNLKKALLTSALSFSLSLIVVMFSFIVPLDITVAFLITLGLIIAMIYQNYFRSGYLFFAKNGRLLTFVSVLSLGFFAVPLLISFSIATSVPVILLFSIIAIYLNSKNRLEAAVIIKTLQSATPDNFLRILEEVSSEHQKARIMYQYTLETNSIKEMNQSVLKELEKHKDLGTFKDYECILTKEQIKINVILSR